MPPTDQTPEGREQREQVIDGARHGAAGLIGIGREVACLPGGATGPGPAALGHSLLLHMAEIMALGAGTRPTREACSRRPLGTAEPLEWAPLE